MRKSIQFRLTAAFISSSVLPLIIVGALIGVRNYQVQLKQTVISERQVVDQVQVAVNGYLDVLRKQLELVLKLSDRQNTGTPEDQNSYSARKQQMLLKLLTEESAFDELTLLNRQGREQIRITRTKTYTQSDLVSRSQADAFIVPVSTLQTYYSPVRFDADSGDPLMTISIPLRNSDTGTVKEILVAETRIKKIWELFKNISLPEKDTIYIVDSLNRVIVHRNPSVVLQGTFFAVPNGNGIHKGIHGDDVVLASQRFELGKETFTIVAEKPLSEAFILLTNSWQIIVFLILASGIITTVFGLLTVRRIIRPIQTLALAAKRISGGNLSQKVTIEGNGEIGDLAQSFNDMTDKIEHSYQSLEAKVTERTVELNAKVEELERVNKLMVGRELKMVKLKEELDLQKSKQPHE